MRSGGNAEVELEKRVLARSEVEGSVRAQLNVAMYAVRSAIVIVVKRVREVQEAQRQG